VKVLNALLALASAYFLYCLLKPEYSTKALWASFFLLGMPAYFSLINSSMTEILFSFLLIFSIFLIHREKFLWSALIISLLPFSRQEGYAFIILFAGYFVYIKAWKYIPFLFCGIVIYSLIGYFSLGDIFWLINKHPYPIKDGVYGYGSPFHFILHSEDIIGVPLLIILVAGILFYCLNRSVLKKNKLRLFMYVLFLFFFIVHSFLWWKGKSGSMGLVRVMACVLPLSAPICLDGFLFLISFIKKHLILIIVKSLIIIYTLTFLLLVQRVPLNWNEQENTINELSRWVRINNYTGRKWVSTEVWLWYFLGKDPYDNTQMQEGFYRSDDLTCGLKSGDMILWESQFGNFHASIDNLMKNEKLNFIKEFIPSSAPIIGNQQKVQYFIFEVK
jgi:hypothetical protein